MSSFNCEHCGKQIIDSPRGYITGCKHYPLSGPSKVKSAWSTTKYMYSHIGDGHSYGAYMADHYCERYAKAVIAASGVTV